MQDIVGVQLDCCTAGENRLCMSRTCAFTIDLYFASCAPLICDVPGGGLGTGSVLEAAENPWRRNSTLKMAEELRCITVMFC